MEAQKSTGSSENRGPSPGAGGDFRQGLGADDRPHPRLAPLWQPDACRDLYRRLRRAKIEKKSLLLGRGFSLDLPIRAVQLCERAFRASRIFGEAAGLHNKARDFSTLAAAMPPISQLQGRENQTPLQTWFDNAGKALAAHHGAEQIAAAARAGAVASLEEFAIEFEDLLWDVWEWRGALPADEPNFHEIFQQISAAEPQAEGLTKRWAVLLGLALLFANWLAKVALEALGEADAASS